MLLNNISISDRHGRPIVLSPVGLQAHFLSDGEYTDPYQISAVTVFSRNSNLYPDSVLNSTTQLINTSAVSGSILMNFSNSSVDTTNIAFLEQKYSRDITSSGIYKIGTGKYIVVLDGTLTGNSQLSGTINLDGANKIIKNQASSTGDYIDVWTVRMYPGSELQTIINDFSLRKGGFTVVTEPLMVKTKNRLVNSKVTLGSKVNLKVATDVVVENTTIDESVKNLLRDTVITSGSIEIQKLNDAANLPARVTVSSYSDTSALVSITGDNVLMFTWDTSLLPNHPQLVAGNFGSIQGIYSIKVKYRVFNEIIISDPMFLTLS